MRCFRILKFKVNRVVGFCEIENLIQFNQFEFSDFAVILVFFQCFKLFQRFRLFSFRFSVCQRDLPDEHFGVQLV